MVTFTELEAEPELPPPDASPGEPTKRWFGKRPRP
jgi:hypothetical protein